MHPDVVFLPGAVGTPDFWRPVADRLPAGWEKILLGWPGAGDQPHDPNVGSFEDLVELTQSTIRRRSDVVAQSMGGVVAMGVALRYPEKIRRLVLVATSGGIDVRALGAADWRATFPACLSRRADEQARRRSAFGSGRCIGAGSAPDVVGAQAASPTDCGRSRFPESSEQPYVVPKGLADQGQDTPCAARVGGSPCKSATPSKTTIGDRGTNLLMDAPQIVPIGEPDEVREFVRGRLEIYRVGGLELGRAVTFRFILLGRRRTRLQEPRPAQ